jgi:hypothetical protein
MAPRRNPARGKRSSPSRRSPSRADCSRPTGCRGRPARGRRAERGGLPHPQGPEPPRRDRPLLAHRAGALERLRAGRAGKRRPAGPRERFVLALLRESFGFASLAKVELPCSPSALPHRHAALGVACRWSSRPPAAGSTRSSPAFGDGLGAAAPSAWRRSTSTRGRRAVGPRERRLTLRIVRDNASLTRPAWIEADLCSDLHRGALRRLRRALAACSTRPASDAGPARGRVRAGAWRSAGREEGTRAREHLRRAWRTPSGPRPGLPLPPGQPGPPGGAAGGALPTRDYFTSSCGSSTG